MVLDRIGTIARMVRYGIPMARLRPSSTFTVADVIEKQAASRGAHPFVLFEDRRVSYGEYNADANRVAHWALDQGLHNGDVVALLMQNRPEYLACWGGLTKLGVTTALLNTNLLGAALQHAVEAAGTQRIIVGSECLSSYESLDPSFRETLEPWVWEDPAGTSPAVLAGAQDLTRTLTTMPATNPDAAVRKDVRSGDPVVFIYTSGTTGLPKAARMSHLRMAGTGSASLIAGFGRRDTMYCALPLYHSAGGAMCVMTALLSGGTLAVRRRFSARGFWDDARMFEATAFQYIGEFCRYLLNQPQSADDSDHAIRFAIGNGLRPDIWEEFQQRFGIPKIVEFYGATEGNVAMLNYDNKVGSVGKRPPAIVSAPKLVRFDVESDEHVRNAEGLCEECEPDEIGELVGEIPRNPDTALGRFEGYTSKEATDRKILRDVFKKGDTWFRTGDLLRCDRAGYFYFVDRIGDTFRWKGENVSTQEVAEALAVYPGIEMCNVYGVDIAGADGRAGMAAIVMSDTSAFDGKSLWKLVSDSLPAYAAPVFIRLQPETDITGTFKLRKVDLQKEGYDPEVVKDPLYVRDDATQEYVPLTPDRLRAVVSGELRV